MRACPQHKAWPSSSHQDECVTATAAFASLLLMPSELHYLHCCYPGSCSGVAAATHCREAVADPSNELVQTFIGYITPCGATQPQYFSKEGGLVRKRRQQVEQHS